MRSPTLIPIAAVLALCACPPAHVQLQDVPDKNRPMQERLAAYQNLQPAYKHKIDVTVTAGPYRDYAGSDRYVEFVQLEDGRRVWVAADLKPAVDPDSATAKAIHDENFHNEKAKVWGWVAAGVMGSGLAIFSIGPMIAMLPSIAFGKPQDAQTGPLVPLAVAASGVAIVAVGTSALVPLIHHTDRRADARARAFQNFHRDLRTHLGLNALPTKGDPAFDDVNLEDGSFQVVAPPPDGVPLTPTTTESEASKSDASNAPTSDTTEPKESIADTEASQGTSSPNEVPSQPKSK